MFDILMDTKVVGSAELTKEGLYYRFFCTCKLPDDGIYRVTVSDGNHTRDLGVCVPSGMVARVPQKYFQGDTLSFTLISNKGEENRIVVNADTPFEELDMLDSSRLKIADGRVEIMIDPTPDLQGNDPNQEPRHKLEQP